MGTDIAGYAHPHYLGALVAPDFMSFLEHSFGNRYDFRELGYKLLCYFTSNAFRNENLLLFVYQLFTISCVYIGAYRHKDRVPIPMIMFAFLFMYYNQTYNIIRQSMATAVIFMGLYDMEEGRYAIFLAYIFAASLFHSSAFVGIPLLLLFHVFNSSKFFRKNVFIRLILICCSAVFMLMARPIMMLIVNSFGVLSRYNSYFYNEHNEGGIVWGLVLITLGELVMAEAYPNGAERTLGFSEGNIRFYKFQAVFILIFASAVRFFTRVVDYSAYANLIFLAALPNFVREKRMRLVVYCCVIGVTVFWWVWKTIHMGHNETYPYRSIL